MHIKKGATRDDVGLRMIDMMELRKKQLFPDVPWAFNISVRKENGPYPFIIRAEVRMPDPLIPKVPKRWRHLISREGNVFNKNSAIIH